jgi:hypothetical protein
VSETHGARAADLYLVSLQPRPGGRVLQGARFLAAFAGELVGGATGPSLHDVVVTRRADGAEVLRVPAGDPNVPGNTVGLVQHDLDVLDPAAFLARWDPSAPPAPLR